MIRRLEEFSLNAWPALQTLLYDGWVLRFANGYTKRANSINPLYASTLDLREKIEYCERVYQSRNQRVVFKMTASVQPENLDEVLNRAGYRVDSPTSVQLLDLAALSEKPIHPATLSETLTDTWLDDFCQLSKTHDRDKPTIKRMLGQGILQECFAEIRDGDRAIVLGLGVLQVPYIAFFDIVVAPDMRNRGFGKQIMLSLLEWGKRNGAGVAYLSVMLNNPPALRLYEKLGFKEVYQYWYRIK